MSFIAKLQFSDSNEDMNILHCGFRFSQVTDATGKPTAIPQGGTINLVLESTGSSDLFHWMISPVQLKAGTITFFRRDSMSKLKTLQFEDAHCVEYYETFDHIGDHPMQVQLMLSAHKIKLNEIEFENNWPS